ncbi:MAG: N-acetylmuramoyl-L-alanine amidase [Bacteroidia bacterium]
MKKLSFIILLLLMAVLHTNAQIIVLDPGHGYGTSTSDNPDGRTATEIETSLSVGEKTKALIDANCTWTVYMTRTTNINGWISVNQRAQMSNNWNADRLLSIHCNAGGGTGTETFYCTYDDTSTAPDIAFAQKIQADMVSYGSWNNRRCVEDNSFLAYHLGVLRYSSATGCLNEIGFVDFTSDATKLNSDTWRNNFANGYFNALKSNLNLTCSPATPGTFTLTLTPECVGTATRNRLNWTTSANATAYDIYRNGSLYASNITGTQYLNTSVNGGTSYTYYVKAKNGTATANNSNGTLTANTLVCNATPGSFTLSATATCSGTQSAINVTWTTSANATSYDLYRNGNLYAPDLTGNSFLNTYLITAGSTYTFSMVAKNANGSANNSNGTISRTAVSCARPATGTTEGKDIIISPNPTRGQFGIQLAGNNAQNVQYSIFDITGKLVQQKVLDTNGEQYIPVDITPLAPGTYLININAGGATVSKKIIKN